MSSMEKFALPTVKNIIVIASGKGGVGKSTVSANIAISLARQGLRVALVDADIYGPSIPKMLGIEGVNPEVSRNGEQETMFPIEKYGVKVMSIGFFIAKDKGLIWRGPMASNAISQLIENTEWGDLDYMIIDFPPGTGDIQLTTVQKYDVTGAIIVTTPQEIALNDARKAVSLFNTPGVTVPIIGIIENMSWFSPVPHPEEKYYIFGKGGGSLLASETNTPLLGQIPLVAELGEAAEKGLSVYNQPDTAAVKAFDDIVEQMLA